MSHLTELVATCLINAPRLAWCPGGRPRGSIKLLTRYFIIFTPVEAAALGS